MADARVMMQKRKRKKGKKKRTEEGKDLTTNDTDDFQQAMAKDQAGPNRTAAASRLLRLFVQKLSHEVEVDTQEICALLLLACSNDMTLTGGVIQTPVIQRKWRDRVLESAAIHTVSAMPSDQKTVTPDVHIYIANRVVYPVLSPPWIPVDETQLVFDIELCIDLLNSMHENEIAVPGHHGIPGATVSQVVRLLNSMLLVYTCTRRWDFFCTHTTPQLPDANWCESAQDQILMHSISDSLRQLAKYDATSQYLCWLMFCPSEAMRQFFSMDADTNHGMARQFQTGRCIQVSNVLGDVAMGIAARYLLVTSWWGGRSCDLALWQHLIVEMVALVGHALTAHPDLLPMLDALEADDHSLTASEGKADGETSEHHNGCCSSTSEPHSSEDDPQSSQGDDTHEPVTCCDACKAKAAVWTANVSFVPCSTFENMPRDDKFCNAHVHPSTAFMLALRALRRKSPGQLEVISPAEAIQNVFQFRWHAPLSLRYTPWIVPVSSG